MCVKSHAAFPPSEYVLFCFVLFCLSGRLPRRKVGILYFRDLASRPGVGICNTPYQDLPTYVEPGIEQTGQFNPNTTTATPQQL